MAQVTYFVVQSFQAGHRGALVPDAPMMLQSADAALRRAQSAALSRAGVVAFSRTGDPTTGDFEDAKVLYAHGQLPADAEAI